MKIKSKILIIAGSDSSGGAGIQADIKTSTSLGVYSMTSITAVTTQTSNAAVNNILTKDETTGELVQLLSSGNPVTSSKVPASHDIKTINSSYGINTENGYQERKGSFFNTQRLYNSGQTIEFLSTNTIESIDTTVINKYNTRTNVNIA